jgi:ABC-type lipoprotein export system ATPase subunit
MAQAQPLLKLEHVSKQYRVSDAGTTLPVLQDVSIEIRAGESVGIIGPSGSGKSTVLNILGTLDQPTSGKVWLAGRDLSQLNEESLADIRNLEIGFVFQAHHLLPHCSVLENVLVPTLANRKHSRGSEAESQAMRLLQRVGLDSRRDHRPGQLSGGERQRVAVVRALINRPKLLLADEPTGALDRAAAGELGTLLVELNREENVTLVVVTHALDLAHRMGRVLELRDGQLRDQSAASLSNEH